MEHIKHRIIVSSKTMANLIYHFITPLIPEQDEYEVKVKCVQKQLWFNESEKSLNIESNHDFMVRIEIGNLRRLFRVLTKVPEQPLTLTFEDYGWIQVDTLTL